jgi:hypothetical protein
MPKLHQILAVTNSSKARAVQGVTSVYNKLAKVDLLSGMSRTYLPKDDEGQRLPAENKRIQLTTDDAINEAKTIWQQLFDVVLTQDAGNCLALADIVVDGETLATDVPATHLLFLEKQMKDVAAFVERIPTLDPTQDWTYSESKGCWASAPIETTKTQKVPRNHVKAEATDKHPAQVELFTEDVVVGTWTKVDFSGAIPVNRKKQLVERVAKLSDAVKAARCAANSVEVTQRTIGSPLLEYLFPNTVG